MSEQQAKRTEIADLGEFGLIKHLSKSFKNRQTSTYVGIGDDAAVLDYRGDHTVVSTDLLLEGVHFDLMYMPLKHLGYKAVVVNLSDIYAMNATPKQITMSIGVSNRFSVEALEEFYEGVRLACERYEVDLIGGDTTSSLKGFVISVTAIGAAQKENIVGRASAKEGDLICVTGDIGAAYLGLQILEREKQIYLEHPEVQPDLGNNNYVIGRQLKPEARKDIFDLLAAEGVVPTSMIDISDGLSSELHHICERSKVGCHIYEAELPINEDAFQLALDFSLDPTMCALNGGEDYELLFTIDPADDGKISHHVDIEVIGKVTAADKGLLLETKGGNIHPLKAQGWTHLGS